MGFRCRGRATGLQAQLPRDIKSYYTGVSSGGVESRMDVDKQLDQQRLDQLTAMKSAFATGRYPAVLEALEQLGPLDAIRSGIRIEAIALAARTQIALGE